MARNEGGPGAGVTKGKTPQEQADARKLAKQRKQTRKGSKGMHATTLADSALENARVLEENRLAEALPDAFDMALEAIKEYAGHKLRHPVKGTTRTRYNSNTVEGMMALLYWLFDDDANNISDMESRPIYGQPIQTVRRLFVFACETHRLRTVFQERHDWYYELSQDKLLRREVMHRRALLTQAEANAA